MEPALILEEPASEFINEDTECGADGLLFKPKNKSELQNWQLVYLF